MIELLNIDCMEYMKGCEDNSFDLAIVDPPYFDGDKDKNYLQSGSAISKAGVSRIRSDFKTWKKPNKQYFDELKRLSNNQIIWGANYFDYSHANGAIVWDKKNDQSSFSDGEIASTNLFKGVRFFRYMWNGMLQENMKYKEVRIHPNQKPVALYDWLLANYAKPGQRILDTHLGSGSIAIAAHYYGVDFVGCEIDEDYYKAACERFDRETAQKDMFQCR